MIPSCGRCRFFCTEELDDQPGEFVMQCRRFPPQLFADHPDSDYQVGQGWPQMKADDWCGEFQMAGDV